jgi:CheY-like chemotaxis protein
MEAFSSVPATAMVVDLDEQASDVVAGVLASLGCRVIATPDGESALATLKAEWPVDLLLTDVLLRGSIDGPELARLAIETNPRMEVIYSTSYSPMFLLDSEAPRDRLLLRKPWQSGKLKTILSCVLSAQRSAARASADSACRPDMPRAVAAGEERSLIADQGV